MDRALPLVLVLLLLAGLVTAGVAAEEREIERETDTREIEIEEDVRSIEIESKLKNASAGTENAFEVEFDAEEQVEVKLTFKEGRQVDGSEQESELSYAVETEALIEFDDENGNGVYDDGEEISRYSLEDTEFQPISHTTRQTANGVTEHVIRTQSSDGVFYLTLHVVGSFAQLESTEINPTEVKIDFAMLDYPFESDSSSLALLSKLKTERETERETEQGEVEEEEGVSIDAGDVKGFFTWKKTAMVDGQTEQVTSDIRPRDEVGEQGIVLSYPQGERIVHDPRVGFRFSEAGGTGGTGSTPLLPILVIIVAAAAVGIWRFM